MVEASTSGINPEGEASQFVPEGVHTFGSCSLSSVYRLGFSHLILANPHNIDTLETAEDGRDNDTSALVIVYSYIANIAIKYEKRTTSPVLLR